MSRLGVALVTATLATFVGVSGVSAHPALVRSEPADSSVLEKQPDQVRLWFTEPVSERLSTLQLLDVRGASVPGMTSIPDLAARGRLDARLPELPPGVYSLAWQVLSVGDGHVTRGNVVFGVGVVPAIQAAPKPAPISAVPEVILRWIGLLPVVLAVGGVVVNQLVVRGPTTLTWARSWAGIGVLSGTALLTWQVSDAGGQSPDGAWQILTGTRWGSMWLLRQLSLLLIVALPRRPLIVGAVAGLLIAEAAAGHAAALDTDTAPAVVADAAHLLAASVWVGGLFALVTLPRAAAPTPVWVRFGRLAALSVAVLLASGLYSASREVSALDQLSSIYGQALLAKAALAVAMGAIGLLNFARPRRSLLAIESCLGSAALVAVGVMVASPPARDARAAPPGPIALSRSVGDLLVAFEVKPNQPGTNLISLRVASTRRPAPAPIGQVLVRFVRPPSADDSGWLEAEPIGRDSLFQVASEALTQAGHWRAEVLIKRPGQTDMQTTLAWNLGAVGAVAPGYAEKE